MWRIYYGDGEGFSGPPSQAPARNVQLIAQSDSENGWVAISGHDYYVFRGGRWFGVDLFGLYDYLIEPGWKRVLFGRTLTSSEYNEVWRQAMSDPDLPPKTGGPKRERKP